MVTSQTGVQGRGELEQKLDKSYFIHTIPGQIPAKKVWFQHFPVLWHRSQSTFQKNFSTGFQVFVCFFLVPCLRFWKEWIKFPDAEFIAESTGTNFKSQKWKSKKLVCPFLIIALSWDQLKVGHFGQLAGSIKKIFFANQADFKDTFLLIQTTLD